MTGFISQHETLSGLVARLARRISLLGLCTLLSMLGGCGEVSFKRGGGLGDLETSRHSCHSQYADDAGYTKCMAAAGWYTNDLDSAPATTAPPAGVAPPVAGSIPAAAPYAGSNAAIAVAPQPAAASGPGAPPAPAPAAADTSSEMVTVGSWWKFGGGEGDLVVSLPQCGGTPEMRNRVTRATLLCMKGKGWYGVGTK